MGSEIKMFAKTFASICAVILPLFLYTFGACLLPRPEVLADSQRWGIIITVAFGTVGVISLVIFLIDKIWDEHKDNKEKK